MISERCGQNRVWKNLMINDKDHMICFTKENESWKVFLTNLIEIWAETLTDETLFHKCKVHELSQVSHIRDFHKRHNIFELYYICAAALYTLMILVLNNDSWFVAI